MGALEYLHTPFAVSTDPLVGVYVTAAVLLSGAYIIYKVLLASSAEEAPPFDFKTVVDLAGDSLIETSVYFYFGHLMAVSLAMSGNAVLGVASLGVSVVAFAAAHPDSVDSPMEFARHFLGGALYMLWAVVGSIGLAFVWHFGHNIALVLAAEVTTD